MAKAAEQSLMEQLLAHEPIFWTDTSVTALVARAPAGPLNEAVRVHGAAEVAAAYGEAADSALTAAAGDFFANGGRVALAVRAETLGEGVAALERADPFQLLVVDTDLAVDGTLAEAHALCVARQAFLLADADEPGEVPEGLGSNSAVYHPRITDASGRARPCAPAVAGVVARMDAARGVWKAPAGSSARVVGAAGVEHALSDRRLAELNARQVNVLRPMPDGAVVVWGARTTSPDEEWKYVAVRRLFLFLAQTVEAGLQWVVHEPNTEELWQQVCRDVQQFLTRLWREGAFPGEKPQEAFFVHCDRTTMTEDDLQHDRLVCEVGIAPIRPAEFVTFRVVLTTAGRAAAPPAP